MKMALPKSNIIELGLPRVDELLRRDPMSQRNLLQAALCRLRLLPEAAVVTKEIPAWLRSRKNAETQAAFCGEKDVRKLYEVRPFRVQRAGESDDSARFGAKGRLVGPVQQELDALEDGFLREESGVGIDPPTLRVPQRAKCDEQELVESRGQAVVASRPSSWTWLEGCPPLLAGVDPEC